MSLTIKQTPRGKVVVGDLPADFLRLPAAPANQQFVQNQQAAQVLLQQPGFVSYPSMQTSNIRGRLSISVAQAKLTKNYGLTKMDPYCRIRIGHAVFETPTSVNGAKNPRWNKTVQCYLPHGVDHAYIEIFDEGDDRVAWAHIPIPEATLNGDTVDDWFTLSGKQGEGKEGMINIIFSFIAVDVPTMSVQQPMISTQVMMPGAPGMFYPGMQQAPVTYQPVHVPIQPGGQPLPSGQPAVQPAVQMQVQTMGEDDLNQCKDMFPNIDMDVIKSVAEANRGDKDATINALLTLAD